MTAATQKTLSKLIDRRNRRALPGLVETDAQTHQFVESVRKAAIVGERERGNGCFSAFVGAVILLVVMAGVL